MQGRKEQGTAVILRPSGRVDADTCWELRQELADAFAGGFFSVIVDLADVEAVDVHALQVLVGARAFLRARGGVLVVTSVCPEVLSLIRVHELTELLEVPSSAQLELPERAPARHAEAAPSLRPVTQLPVRTAQGRGPSRLVTPRPVSRLNPRASSDA